MARKSQAKTIEALRAFWKPKERVVHGGNAKALNAWLKKHAAGVDIATFIHSSQHERRHSKAIAHFTK
jgi:hypothetical protein